MTHKIMKKGTAVLTMVAALAGLSACHEDNEYYSAIITACETKMDVYVSLQDERGNNLAADMDFLSSLEIESRDELAERGHIVEVNDKKYVAFAPPYPKAVSMAWEPDSAQATCQEPVVLRSGQHSIVLNANLLYSYTNETKQTDGGSLLVVESVAVGDTLISRDAAQGHIIVPLTYSEATGFAVRN